MTFIRFFICGIILILAACKDETANEVFLYHLEEGSKKFVISDKEKIKMINQAIEEAEKIPGIADVTNPHFKINVGEESYFLWAPKIDGDAGSIMNTEDTHTLFTLNNQSMSQLNEIIEVSRMPEDFNFSLNYGTYGIKKIDTFKSIVRKDLVEDGTAKAKITLDEKEMNSIYYKMMEIDIMGKLDLAVDKQCSSKPPTTSSWKIAMHGEIKTIEYGSYCGNYPDNITKLLELEQYIHQIISNKEEYKQLPEARGSYE